MRLRVRPDRWATSLLMTLGLLSVAACAGSSDDDGTNKFPCVATTDDNGYVACENGVTIRERAEQCPSSLPRPEAQSADPALGECQYDADCTAMPNGYCSTATFAGGDASGGYCYYGCTTDAD